MNLFAKDLTYTINLDFDGTVVTHEFPKIGKDIGAVSTLKELIDNGHRIILFTMRSDIENPTSQNYNIPPKGGNYLTDSENWFKENNIPLYGINTNPDQLSWTTSPKSYADIMIDDSAIGCPLVYDKTISDRPFVDWKQIRKLLMDRGLFNKEDDRRLTTKILIEEFKWENFPRERYTDPHYYKTKTNQKIVRDENKVLIYNKEKMFYDPDLGGFQDSDNNIIQSILFASELMINERLTDFYFNGVLNNSMTVQHYKDLCNE